MSANFFASASCAAAIGAANFSACCRTCAQAVAFIMFWTGSLFEDCCQQSVKVARQQNHIGMSTCKAIDKEYRTAQVRPLPTSSCANMALFRLMRSSLANSYGFMMTLDTVQTVPRLCTALHDLRRIGEPLSTYEQRKQPYTRFIGINGVPSIYQRERDSTVVITRASNHLRGS